MDGVSSIKDDVAGRNKIGGVSVDDVLHCSKLPLTFRQKSAFGDRKRLSKG